MSSGILIHSNAPRPLSPGERRWLTASVAGVHLVALWALLQMEPARRLVRERAPLVVNLLSIALPMAPPQAAAPPPPAVAPATPAPPAAIRALATAPAAPAATPAISTAAPNPTPSPTPTPAPVAAFAVAEPPALAAAPSPPAPASPPTPVAPPAPPAPPPVPAEPRAVAASALRYALPPQIDLPLASRRLGESGTVLLRVVFDVQGRAKQITVQRSSGYARLDDHAVQAMRLARITPYLDKGQAIEVVAQAPLVFELE